MPLRVVSFQGLRFHHARARCRDSAGNVAVKWIPYGMPALDETYSQSVFYLFGPGKNGEQIALGSGVFVSCPCMYRGVVVVHEYAVTALHVLKGASSLRVNTKDGASRPIPINMDEWAYVEDWEDLAAYDVTDELRHDTDEISIIPTDLFVSDDFINDFKVGPGDEGFMIGLFSPHPGQARNLPAPRFGCVSMLANDREPIRQEQEGSGIILNRPAHVFEIKSRPGFSGSPVFIYRTPVTNLAQLAANGDWNLDTSRNLFLRMLGIHVGQFREPALVRNREAAIGPQPIFDGANAYLPSSMTIIVPAKEIVELLNMPKLRDQRLARHVAALPSHVIQESVAQESVPTNPTHREDFTHLLNAAAKAKPQGD